MSIETGIIATPSHGGRPGIIAPPSHVVGRPASSVLPRPGSTSCESPRISHTPLGCRSLLRHMTPKSNVVQVPTTQIGVLVKHAVLDPTASQDLGCIHPALLRACSEAWSVQRDCGSGQSRNKPPTEPVRLVTTHLRGKTMVQLQRMKAAYDKVKLLADLPSVCVAEDSRMKLEPIFPSDKVEVNSHVDTIIAIHSNVEPQREATTELSAFVDPLFSDTSRNPSVSHVIRVLDPPVLLNGEPVLAQLNSHTCSECWPSTNISRRCLHDNRPPKTAGIVTAPSRGKSLARLQSHLLNKADNHKEKSLDSTRKVSVAEAGFLVGGQVSQFEESFEGEEMKMSPKVVGAPTSPLSGKSLEKLLRSCAREAEKHHDTSLDTLPTLRAAGTVNQKGKGFSHSEDALEVVPKGDSSSNSDLESQHPIESEVSALAGIIMSKKSIKCRHWTAAEDAILREEVEKHGGPPYQWGAISARFNGTRRPIQVNTPHGKTYCFFRLISLQQLPASRFLLCNSARLAGGGVCHPSSIAIPSHSKKTN
jgi:hypothetical protein